MLPPFPRPSASLFPSLSTSLPHALSLSHRNAEICEHITHVNLLRHLVLIFLFVLLLRQNMAWAGGDENTGGFFFQNDPKNFCSDTVLSRALLSVSVYLTTPPTSPPLICLSRSAFSLASCPRRNTSSSQAAGAGPLARLPPCPGAPEPCAMPHGHFCMSMTLSWALDLIYVPAIIR
jgi:hypothetical protein